MSRPRTLSSLFPYTPLFRSPRVVRLLIMPTFRVGELRSAMTGARLRVLIVETTLRARQHATQRVIPILRHARAFTRSEEHTSELQSLRHLVCRLLLEKKKTA